MSSLVDLIFFHNSEFLEFSPTRIEACNGNVNTKSHPCTHRHFSSIKIEQVILFCPWMDFLVKPFFIYLHVLVFQSNGLSKSSHICSLSPHFAQGDTFSICSLLTIFHHFCHLSPVCHHNVNFGNCWFWIGDGVYTLFPMWSQSSCSISNKKDMNQNVFTLCLYFIPIITIFQNILCAENSRKRK